MSLPIDYVQLLSEVKGRIQAAQTRAVLAVNAELVHLYWQVGGLLDQRQQQAGWGAAVIPRLAQDLANALPELKGFSTRNLDRMVAFARAYPRPLEFAPQAVAKLPGAHVAHHASPTVCCVVYGTLPRCGPRVISPSRWPTWR